MLNFSSKLIFTLAFFVKVQISDIIKNAGSNKLKQLKQLKLLALVGLSSLDTYIARRQLRWAGHVARMNTARLPRKMLSSWVCQKRPLGCPQYKVS